MDKIGIFDSGIGGFTVAKAIHHLLPQECLCYFGDTAHLPYGDKPDNAIQKYAVKISAFLFKQKIKMLVIACNSASSVAFEILKKKYKNIIPVVDTVSPIITYIQNTPYHKIGVIGTKATVRSKIHQIKIHQKCPKIKIESLPTPLLAPMIEEGFYNNTISKTIIESYLSHYKLKNIEALILACTHYPLIKKQIINYYTENNTKQIDIIDPAGLVAIEVQKTLKNHNLLSKNNTTTLLQHQHDFYVSNWTASFEASAKLFWGKSIKLTEKNIWK